jgi:hypothetical protein
MSVNGPKLNADNNPGNARWCTESGHNRLECTKNRSRGRGQCHGPAIRGTDSCKIHGGRSRREAIARGRVNIITAWTAKGEPAEGEGVDASTAVMGMLNESWLRSAALSELLRRQVIKDGDVAGELTGGDDRPDMSGLIGFRYGAAGKDGNIFAQSEEARALVVLEAQERDRVVKYATEAHKMGISERETELAERWGDLVITRLMNVLDSLSLTPEQERRVPGLIQTHLGRIEITSGSKA